jgi:hypothetical protein
MEAEASPTSSVSKKPSFKRSNYFINPKFQIKFMGSDFGMPPDHVFFTFINEQQAFMNQIFFGTAFIAFIGITYAGVLYSHRIAGPLFHLKKHMREIAQGGPIRNLGFRKKDFFQEIPDEFNSMLKVLAPPTSSNQPPQNGGPIKN